MKGYVIAIIFILVLLCAYLISYFFYSPGYTDNARYEFILEALETKSFKELSENHEQDYHYGDRTVYAHWETHRRKSVPGIFVEFDVHPSKMPFTISASEFIYIRDEDHLKEIKKDVAESYDYTPYWAKEEDVHAIYFGEPNK